MSFSYLYNKNKLTHLELLDNTLDKINRKIKLNKYNCIEIGPGNCNNTIPLLERFKTYYAIEPSKELYDICIDNLNKHNMTEKCKMINLNFDDFIEQRSDLLSDKQFFLFINSFQFINFKSLIKLPQSYYIIILTRYDSNRWGDKRLNRNSDIFDENLLLKHKEFLDRYETFINEKFKMIYTKTNDTHKIFVCKK